jgi:chaperonin GroES
MVDNPDPMMVETGYQPGMEYAENAIGSADTEAEPETIDQMAWLTGAPDAPNLLDYFSEEQRAELAKLVLREYEIDCDSMGPWLKAMEAGLKLAQGDRDEKTFPWKGASNVRYPLVMTAALQFNARAYPAIVPPGDIVKCVVHGVDPQGQKRARGERVSKFMSHQLRRTMPEWEGDTDRLLMQLAVVGKMFRKTWFDPTRGRMVSRVPKAGAVKVNAAVSCLDDAPRISEDVPLYPHEIMERQRAGLFLAGDWFEDDAEDTSAPEDFIEQHRLYDFDGDGYPEPYVIFVHKKSEAVVRIVANWKPDGVMAGPDSLVRIARRDYYEAFDFIPAVDGGFWSIGLGFLLSDISEAVNATINRINDAATLSSLGGGFIGKETRLSGGPIRFKPGEWKQITASGADLRSAVVPVPASEPSPVLFQMLGLLIDAAREVANVKDIQSEASRSNQPATTTIALIEEGMKVFTAIYQRIHRSLRGEFHRMAEINRDTVDPQIYQVFLDEPADPSADFQLDDFDIEPVADPRAVTSPQKLAQAQFVNELAANGQVDPAEATMRALNAAGIPNTDALMPKPDPMAEQAAQMQAMAMEAQTRAAMLANVEAGLRLAKIEAEIAKMHADATKTMADAEAADPFNPVNVAMSQVEMLKGLVDADRRRLDGMANASGDGARDGGVAQGGGSPQGADAGGLLAFGGSEPAPVGPGAGIPGLV